ncbi:MAG: ATP-binding cassette domain-containing protein, partial [Clostridia bacterium]|nr:ATP-binding cassette domain-containing protein [Clostridia bacterium]
NAVSGYSWFDRESGRKIRVTSKNEGLFMEDAICFYKPFPNKKLSVPALFVYIFDCIPFSSRILLVLAALIVSLVGMLSPRITNIVFSDVLESENLRLLIAAALFAVSVNVSVILFTSIKNLLNARIATQTGIAVEAATMARILSLPAKFFKQFSAGELSTKVQSVNTFCASLFSTFTLTGLTSVTSLLYLFQIFKYAPALVLPSLLITLTALAFTATSTLLRMKETKAAMEIAEKKNGMTYALITGIQKIKLSGSEKRAFARWTRVYNEEVKHTYGIPNHLILSETIVTAIYSLGTIVMYFTAVKNHISVADYYAFTTAYGVVSGAFSALVGIGLQVASIRPILDQIKPILDAVPETDEGKTVVSRLSGLIELENVSFRYADNQPNVIENLSLRITPGQYVAIVGKTGCGKSTLFRLLLGFETAQKGVISFDKKSIETLDLKSLHKNIGVVMQNGKLFHGDIYSNITISAPWLSLDDAWKAAELAGIADDIREMPMGMNTMISEGSGGISGGQKQRLMIARAIAPNPKILMFDEATSALDNVTQKKVSESLNSLKCTRIVIAHRLSTIRQCDRVIVLDGGNIIEDGTYDELIAKNGFFAELVARQRIET